MSSSFVRYDAGRRISPLGALGDLPVANIFFQRAEIPVLARNAPRLDDHLADFPGAELAASK